VGSTVHNLRYRKYRASLMKSGAIRSAMAARRANQDFETLSVDDVALLLKSTDELMRSLSKPSRANQ
jgi:hypothetical protein